MRKYEPKTAGRCDWCGQKPPRGTELEPLIVVGGYDWICIPCRRRGTRRPVRKPRPKPTFGPRQTLFQFMHPN
jgi:hypothetical protein